LVTGEEERKGGKISDCRSQISDLPIADRAGGAAVKHEAQQGRDQEQDQEQEQEE
jgi:hypothetical protein